MIIRLTVGDNDFGYLMEKFVSNLSSRIYRLPDGMEALDSKRQMEILRELNIVSRLINPNVTENHTKSEKQFLIRKIREVFTEFVYNSTDDSTAEYLINNFKVEIIKSMEDKWENGEAWYWFQHSGVYINQ